MPPYVEAACMAGASIWGEDAWRRAQKARAGISTTALARRVEHHKPSRGDLVGWAGRISCRRLLQQRQSSAHQRTSSGGGMHGVVWRPSGIMGGRGVIGTAGWRLADIAPRVRMCVQNWHGMASANIFYRKKRGLQDGGAAQTSSFCAPLRITLCCTEHRADNSRISWRSWRRAADKKGIVDGRAGRTANILQPHGGAAGAPRAT